MLLTYQSQRLTDEQTLKKRSSHKRTGIIQQQFIIKPFGTGQFQDQLLHDAYITQ